MSINGFFELPHDMGVKWLQYITKCECCSCGLSLLSDRHWRGPSSDIGRLWLVPHPNFHGRKISMCSLQLLHGLVSVTPPLGVHPQTAARSLGLGVRTPSLGDASPSPSWRGVGWAGSSRGGAGGGTLGVGVRLVESDRLRNRNPPWLGVWDIVGTLADGGFQSFTVHGVC